MTHRHLRRPNRTRRVRRDLARAARLALFPLALGLTVLGLAACATAGSQDSSSSAESATAGTHETTEMASSEPAAAPPPAIERPLPATPPGPDGAAGGELCFYGPVTETPVGAPDQAQVTADRLVRRTLDPEASRIVEETVRIDRASNRRTRPFRTIYEVDGDSFELREETGIYSGQGTLEGEAWRWTAWEYAYALDNGIRVRGRVEIRPAASDDHAEPRALMLVIDSDALGPDGSEVLRLHEELAQISAEECAERLPRAES